MPIIPYTEQTAYDHARIGAELESSGNMIRYYDIISDATALERGGKVATFNPRYSRINRSFQGQLRQHAS